MATTGKTVQLVTTSNIKIFPSPFHDSSSMIDQTVEQTVNCSIMSKEGTIGFSFNIGAVCRYSLLLMACNQCIQHIWIIVNI